MQKQRKSDMVNTSTIAGNADEHQELKFYLSLIPVVFFIYVNCIMLFTVTRKAAFHGVSRYILFGNMLCADSLQLLLSMVVYLIAVVEMNMTNGLCAILLLLTSITTSIAPINLAIMSLERYSAICFPLRHAEITTNKWTGVAIGVGWVLGSLNSVTLFFLFVKIGPPFFGVKAYCRYRNLFYLKLHSDIDKAFTTIYFSLVGLVIIYTYIAIMAEAKSAASDKSKTTKARNTVLLHLIQLGLCLSSFMVIVLNRLAFRLDAHRSRNVRYVIFMAFIILPRCMSPVIYGLRDEMFRPVFVYNFTFGLKNKVKPSHG